MELSQRHSSSAQSSDYTVHFHAVVSLQKHSTLKNGTVLKQFFCLYFIFCFFFQAPDLLFPHGKSKAVSESEKDIVARLLSQTLASPLQLPLVTLLVCYTMGRHCKGSLTDLKIKKKQTKKKQKSFSLPSLPPNPPPKKLDGWNSTSVGIFQPPLLGDNSRRPSNHSQIVSTDWPFLCRFPEVLVFIFTQAGNGLQHERRKKSQLHWPQLYNVDFYI